MIDRHIKVGSQITEMAATYVQHEANTDPLITITRTTVSPDYRKATIMFTTIPSGKEKDAEIFLHRHAGELRRYLMKKMNIKIIPHLEFMLDVGERHRQHMDELVVETGTKSTFPEKDEKETP
ncbi:ribosome-binding factor A [Candidatus Kaiserbacteria bacterium]|nr:ribosome-binding factor A [Candidatus Kaiserbacteria bacterium]